MKSLAIFPEEIKVHGILKTANKFIIENEEVNTGLIEEEDLKLEDCDDPENKVLVKKKAFSCNYRDKAVLLRSDRFIKEEAELGELNFTYLGSEFVGEVIAIGSNIKDFKVGDKVIPNISYPSYEEDYRPGVPTNYASSRIEDFKSNKLIKIPKDFDISDEVLAAFPIAGFTTYSMIRKVVKPNSKVLVTAGSSNTSLAAISALNKHPVEVYVMTSNTDKIDFFKKMGVKDVLIVNHKLENYAEDETLRNKVEEIGGFDAAIDPFFDIYLPRVIDFLKTDAKYVTCGLYNQYPEFDDGRYEYKGNSFNNILIKSMIKNISIIGNCIGLKEDGLEALEDLKNGTLDIFIDSVFSSGEENLFLDRTFNARDRIGKVVYKYED